MGDWARDNDSGGSEFTEQQLRRVVAELERHRGRQNAVKLVEFAHVVGLPHDGRTLRAIWAYLARHPEEGVVKCSDHRGGIFAGATVREIEQEADYHEAMGRASLEHGRALRRNAAHLAAAQPTLFECAAEVY